jgi:hypothetical protein
MIKIKDGVKNITGKGFRLIWVEKKVVALIEGTERTVTSTAAFRDVEEKIEKQAALDRITELGLEYTPPDMEDKSPERKYYD